MIKIVQETIEDNNKKKIIKYLKILNVE